MAKGWNDKNPGDALVDSKQQKVSFEDKFDVWIPKMLGGKFDKSTAMWAGLKELARIRDRGAHPKSAGIGTLYEDLANLVNMFREGAAGTQIQLHYMFGVPVPSSIIRAHFLPDVEVVVVEK